MIVFIDANLGKCALIPDDAELFPGWIVRDVNGRWVTHKKANDADKEAVRRAAKAQEAVDLVKEKLDEAISKEAPAPRCPLTLDMFGDQLL